jgi:hypothetical protein
VFVPLYASVSDCAKLTAELEERRHTRRVMREQTAINMAKSGGGGGGGSGGGGGGNGSRSSRAKLDSKESDEQHEQEERDTPISLAVPSSPDGSTSGAAAAGAAASVMTINNSSASCAAAAAAANDEHAAEAKARDAERAALVAAQVFPLVQVPSHFVVEIHATRSETPLFVKSPLRSWIYADAACLRVPDVDAWLRVKHLEARFLQSPSPPLPRLQAATVSATAVMVGEEGEQQKQQQTLRQQSEDADMKLPTAAPLAKAKTNATTYCCLSQRRAYIALFIVLGLLAWLLVVAYFSPDNVQHTAQRGDEEHPPMLFNSNNNNNNNNNNSNSNSMKNKSSTLLERMSRILYAYTWAPLLRALQYLHMLCMYVIASALHVDGLGNWAQWQQLYSTDELQFQVAAGAADAADALAPGGASSTSRRVMMNELMRADAEPTAAVRKLMRMVSFIVRTAQNGATFSGNTHFELFWQSMVSRPVRWLAHLGAHH